jgi:nitrogen fixation protein NifU and related proteins
MTYTPHVLDHFRNPRHAGELPAAGTVAEASNPVCGDVVKIWLRLEESAIAGATFKASGCVPTVACASWLMERIQGAGVTDAASITPEDVATGLGGLPSASTHAAQLAVQVLRIALGAAPERV